MHHGAVDGEPETEPRRVRFGLTAPVLVVPLMPVANEVFPSSLVAWRDGSRMRRVTDVRAERSVVSLHSRLRGGSGEIL